MTELASSKSWRLAAIASLLLLGLTAVVGILLLLSNPLWTLLFGFTATLIIILVWRFVFSLQAGRIWPYWLALGFLLIALIIELLYFFGDRNNVITLLVLMGLAALSFGLSTLLRKRYMSEHHQISITAKSHRPYLIINPKSGSGRAIKAGIPQLASKQGIQVLQLQPGGSLLSLLEQAVSEGATMLGISGGDGSIGIAAEVAMQHQIPLVVLPGGTRCHFARDIGLDPEQITDALRAFTGLEVWIDAATINDRVFVNNATFGIYADIVKHKGYREHKLRSVLDVFKQVTTRGSGYPLKFIDGSGQLHKNTYMLLVGVNRYDTVNLAELGVRHQLDEGVLQVTTINHLDPSLVKQLSGIMELDKYAKTHPAVIDQWVTKEFVVSSIKQRIYAGVDGELVELASPVIIKIRPGWLRLMVPPEGLQARRTAQSAINNLKSYAIKGKLPNE